MKNLLIALLSCMALVHTAQAQSISERLKQTGELRTLSQRVPKLYFQDALDLNAAPARRALRTAVDDFDRYMHVLGGIAATPSMQKSYVKAARLWKECRSIVTAPPNRAAATQLSYLTDELMIATGRLAFLLESDAAGTNARLIDLSLRQSMLAQRLAKTYLARRLLGSEGASLVDIQQARTEFTTSLQELTTAPENTQQTQDALALAVAQWIFFEQAVKNADDGERQSALNVVTTSERIGESMGDVVASYASAIRAAEADAAAHKAQSKTTLVQRTRIP